MAKVLVLLYLLAALFSATVAYAATIVPVSLQLLNEIQSNRTVPTPWVIRFVAPNGLVDKERAVFNDAAMLVDSSIAQFGIFTVDTYDKARMIENLGIRSLPSTRFVSFKATRPTGPKGPLSGRVVFMQIDLPLATSSEDIVKTAIVHTAMQYHHPITNQPMPSVTYVLTVDDLIERAKLTATNNDNADASLATLSGGDDAKAVIFYYHLMKKNNINTHAEINSLASRLGPRITVFATEDAEVAKRFGLTTLFSAAAFTLKDVNFDANKKTSQYEAAPKFPETIKTIATADELANAGACAAFAAEHAMPEKEYSKLYETELTRWHKDLASHYTRSPLSKMSHSAQFRRDVMGNKASVTVLFMLREADRLFNRYHRTAIEFATFIRDPYRVAPGIYSKLHQNLNFQSYWIDGEVQNVASQFLGTKAVPSIAFLMHTQQGGVAVKYFTFSEEDKKRRKKQGKDLEWPDVQDLLGYISSDALLMNAPGMITFTDKDIKFNDDLATDGPASANTLDYNHRYLHIDHKHYSMVEEKPNTFISDLYEGKITVDADHYAKDGEEGGSGSGKKSKKSKKAAAKEEERKKKLQAEIERKQREREERTKAKEAADKKRREEDAIKTKAEITAKAKEEAKKAGGKKKAASIVGDSVTAPKMDPSRFAKDYNQWQKAWDNDKRKMVDKFVKNIKGGLRVGKGLTVPDWKKK